MKLSEFIFSIIEAVKGIDYFDYRPHSGKWHAPNQDTSDERCLACLGGLYAAALQWVEKNQYIFATPENNGPKKPLTYTQKRIIDAIDCIRCGQWDSAVHILNEYAGFKGMKPPISSFYPKKPLMEDFRGWDNFRIHIKSLTDRAKELQKHGF